MPLETATYINELVTSNPAASDGLNNADDHMRLIKAALKNSFPAINSGASRSIGNAFGFIVGEGLATAPAYAFGAEPTLGLYRSNAGLILITGGRLDGNGAVPVGSIHQFLYEPSKLGRGGVVPSGGAEYLELDGSTYNTADFPRLAQHMGVTGSNFTLINATDTGRFLRSRTSSLAAGTKQSNALKTFTLASTGSTNTAGSHAHNVSGSTGFMDRNATHSHDQKSLLIGGGAVNYPLQTGGVGFGNTYIGDRTADTDTNHAHGVSGATDAQGNHAHTVTVSGTLTGEAETRPEAIAAIFCIKT